MKTHREEVNWGAQMPCHPYSLEAATIALEQKTGLAHWGRNSLLTLLVSLPVRDRKTQVPEPPQSGCGREAAKAQSPMRREV